MAILLWNSTEKGRFVPGTGPIFRERKMSTNFFLHKLSEHPQGSGTSRQNSRDILDSSLRNPRKTQTFEGGHEVFDPHPFARKTPTPPGGLRTQKVNLCALFSCLNFVPGRGPICPRDGPCLSRTPSCRKCLCLLVFFPDSWALSECLPAPCEAAKDPCFSPCHSPSSTKW